MMLFLNIKLNLI